MTVNPQQAQETARFEEISSLTDKGHAGWTSAFALTIAWKRSLLFKMIVVFLTGIMLAYSVGALVGWSMFVDSAKEQWKNQARINT